MRINVTKSSMPGFDEYIEEIRELWDSHWLTNMGVNTNPSGALRTIFKR